MGRDGGRHTNVEELGERDDIEHQGLAPEADALEFGKGGGIDGLGRGRAGALSCGDIDGCHCFDGLQSVEVEVDERGGGWGKLRGQIDTLGGRIKSKDRRVCAGRRVPMVEGGVSGQFGATRTKEKKRRERKRREKREKKRNNEKEPSRNRERVQDRKVPVENI